MPNIDKDILISFISDIASIKTDIGIMKETDKTQQKMLSNLNKMLCGDGGEVKSGVIGRLEKVEFFVSNFSKLLWISISAVIGEVIVGLILLIKSAVIK